jgi:hypothetical protein
VTNNVISHLHDGGVTIDITAGPQKTLCNSNAVYSKKPEFVYKMGGMAMGNGEIVAKDHISNMDGCGMQDMKVDRVEKSQAWAVTGHYDYTKHDPNQEKSGPSEVMAIAIVLVAVEPGKSPFSNSYLLLFGEKLCLLSIFREI